MKKILMSLALLPFCMLQAQKGYIGVNTKTPKTTLDINSRGDDETIPQGILLPRVTTEQRSKYKMTPDLLGTLVYNTEKKCIERYFGIVNDSHFWDCLTLRIGQNAYAREASIGRLDANPQKNIGDGLYRGTITVLVENKGLQDMNNMNLSNALSAKIKSGKYPAPTVTANENYDNVTLKGGESITLSYTVSGVPIGINEEGETTQLKFEYLPENLSANTEFKESYSSL